MAGLILEDEEPTLRDVLFAVNACNDSIVSLDSQLKSIKEELLSMSQVLCKTVERTTALKEKLSTVEDNLYPLKQEIKGLQEQMATQAAKLDEMENRNRRNNVRVIGLPERSEGPNPIAFLEGWFREIFGAATFTSLFAIERAHRVHSRARQLGEYIRPLLLKLVNYNDKVILLQKARGMGVIMYVG